MKIENLEKINVLQKKCHLLYPNVTQKRAIRCYKKIWHF